MQARGNDYYGRERIGKILLQIAPPVMLAQLIQALYNIVDSFFVGMYSDDALTALSVIYPLQLIIIALAVGTGVGVNTYMARQYAYGHPEEAENAAATGTVLGVVTWALLSAVCTAIMRPFVLLGATASDAVEYAVTYGNIVTVGSIGLLLEGNWTKVHQARGNMRRPMVAQIAGALTNIVLDPLLIFGVGPFPKLGVAGAALATVIGQCVAAVIVAFGAVYKPPACKKLLHCAGQIYRLGYSSILMQSLFTVYILALNVILAKFSDAAVTVLGLYYKLQSFFFIPLFAMETCIIPILSYNCAARNYDRCKLTVRFALLVSVLFMLPGVVGFVFFPDLLIGLFSSNAQVHEIGKAAFPIIGSSFLPAAAGLMMPHFFQAIGRGVTSSFLAVLRQLICLVPLFWAFSFVGLQYTWIAFPLAETVSGGVGYILYYLQLRQWKRETPDTQA